MAAKTTGSAVADVEAAVQQAEQPAQEQEQHLTHEATALLSTYLDTPLPYSQDGWERVRCKGCLSNKRFYCPTCLRIVGAPPSAVVPQLSFPVQIDLVLADYRKKSTGVQAATLAPGSIGIHAFPKEIPLDWDPRRSLVVFPSSDAVTLDEIDQQELLAVERFVLLDSRWNNTTRVLKHVGVERLTRKVKLRAPPSESKFWRYHSQGDGHLSTIEALYFLLKEYEALTGKTTVWATAPSIQGDQGAQQLQAQPQSAPLEELFFLFRLQLRVIKEHYETDGNRRGMPMPMDEAGKARFRQLRCYQGMANKEKKKLRQQQRAAERKRWWEAKETAAAEWRQENEKGERQGQEQEQEPEAGQQDV